jgi:hypothetical protein
MSRLQRIQPRQWLLIALVLIATAALTILLRDTVREAIVIPLAYALWMGDILLSSLPQGLLLGLLIVLCIGIILRSALKSDRFEPEPRPQVITGQHHSRLLFWARQLSRLEDSQFAVEKLAAELKKMLLKILSSQENLTEDEVIDAVRSGTLAVPADIRTLIVRPQDWMKAQPVSGWEQLLRLVRPKRPRKTNPEQTRKIEDAIAFIEGRVNSERIAE